MAVKLIAGHGAGGGRRGPRPGRRDQVPNLGTSPGRPATPAAGSGSSSGPAPVRRPGPGTSRQGRLRFSSPGRGRTSLPGAPAPYPDVTLSDEGVKENAHGPADMDGYQGLPTSHAIRAYLEVLYRL